jgi:hypothetical protein
MSLMPWNDPEIKDDEWLYRRVPTRPDFFQQFDLRTGERILGRGAFQFDDDGMSVYRESLIKIHNLTLRQVRRSTEFLLCKFTVGQIRELEAGVVDDPDPDDDPIGVAHASVRVESVIKPPKPQRKIIQDGLIQVAVFVDVAE